jgi:hypothetical protein
MPLLILVRPEKILKELYRGRGGKGLHAVLLLRHAEEDMTRSKKRHNLFFFY